MNARKIVLPLAVAALLAGLFIGFGGFIQRDSVRGGTSLWCGNLLAPENRYEGDYNAVVPAATQALLDGDCEIVRATKNSWAITLIAVGAALLVSSRLLASTTEKF